MPASLQEVRPSRSRHPPRQAHSSVGVPPRRVVQAGTGWFGATGSTPSAASANGLRQPGQGIASTASDCRRSASGVQTPQEPEEDKGTEEARLEQEVGGLQAGLGFRPGERQTTAAGNGQTRRRVRNAGREKVTFST